jgi:hypothetical protein
MITFALVLVAVLLATFSAIALVRAIAHDGYGSRPPPRSHPYNAPVRSYYDVHIVP